VNTAMTTDLQNQADHGPVAVEPPPKLKRGLFIVLEGMPLAGKTTLQHDTGDMMACWTHPVTAFYRDPSGDLAPGQNPSYLARLLDQQQDGTADGSLDDRELGVLYTLNRFRLSEAIRTCLLRPQNVVCTRWILSTLVFQTNLEIAGQQINLLNTLFQVQPMDWMIYLDIGYDTYRERLIDRPAHRQCNPLSESTFLEYRTRYWDLLDKPIGTYGPLTTLVGERGVLIDARQPLEAVRDEIKQSLSRLQQIVMMGRMGRGDEGKGKDAPEPTAAVVEMS